MTAKPSDMTPDLDPAHGKGTGPFRIQASGLCRSAAALQSRLSGRREHPGLARAGAGRQLPRGLGSAGAATTRCRRCMGGSATTRAKAAAIAASWMRAVASTRWNASSATWRRQEGWPFRIDAPPSGKRVLVVGAGPERLVGRLSPDPARPRGGNPRGRAAGRRHAAFRHPRLSPAARRPDARDRAHRGDGREDRRQPQGDGSAGARSRPAEFDAVFVAIGAHVGKHVDIPARDAVRVLDAVSLLRDVSTGEAAAARPPRGDLWRRQHRDGRGAHRAAPGRRRGADRLSARPRAHAGARVRGGRGARGRRQDQVADHDQGNRRPDLTVEVMDARRATAGRSRPGEFETLQADAVVLALGQDDRQRLPAQRARHRVRRRRHGGGRPDMMTGHPGIFAGGDMVPSERTVTVAVGHGKLRGAPHRRLAARRAYHAPAKHAGRELRHAASAGVQRRRSERRRSACSAAERLSGFEEVVGGLSEKQARHEAQRCLSCGNCFECDNCYAACPEDAIVKLGRAARLSSSIYATNARAARSASSSARATRSR